jgi:hypothetical protein
MSYCARLHRKKSFSIFPSLAGMSFTKFSLGGNNDGKYKIFPPSENLVSDIPAGDRNIEKLFLRCRVNTSPSLPPSTLVELFMKFP